MNKQLDLFGFEINSDSVSDLQKKRMGTYDEDWCFQYDMRQKTWMKTCFIAA